VIEEIYEEVIEGEDVVWVERKIWTGV